MKLKLKFAFAVSALGLATLACAQVTFYEHENFHGRAVAVNRPVNDFQRFGFSDRASSAIVERGRWVVCQDVRFQGTCVVLRRGSYASLAGMSMNDRVSSARPLNNRRHMDYETPEPIAVPAYEYRRRPSERTFQAPVTSVRVVVGPPSERCWIEREQVATGNNAVGGTIAGALIGGILGHQVGGGTGKDLATAGGAVAGGMIGNNMGRNNEQTSERQVRRCQTTASTTPEYWDVSYNFRGVEHRTQMTKAPGPTIEVTSQGQPRL